MFLLSKILFFTVQVVESQRRSDLKGNHPEPIKVRGGKHSLPCYVRYFKEKQKFDRKAKKQKKQAQSR